MFDPSVIGTLQIGLAALDADPAAGTRRRTPTASQRKPGVVRLALAGALRRAAAALDAPPIGEAARG